MVPESTDSQTETSKSLSGSELDKPKSVFSKSSPYVVEEDGTENSVSNMVNHTSESGRVQAGKHTPGINTTTTNGITLDLELETA